MIARTAAVLTSLLLAAAPAARGQGRAGEGTRLVIVTFERRVGASLTARPGEYADSLARWRGGVLDRLFGGAGAAGLLRPGDALALFADGADAAFPGRVALAAGDGGARVDRALVPMLSLPGSATGDPLWLQVVEGVPQAERARADSAIRALVTCPLAGAPPAAPCGDERAWGGRGDATRAFSRPQLTLPVQYRLAAKALRARGRDLPDAVYWIWVQAGERVNEINSLAPEIVRDFGRTPSGTAIARFYGQSVASLGVRPLALPPDARAVGVTLWWVSSAELDRLMVNPAATLPLVVQASASGRWAGVEPFRSSATSLFRAAPPLVEAAPLRVAFGPLPGGDGATLLRVEGWAACRRGAPADSVALAFRVSAGGAAAELDADGREALRRQAGRCLPPQGFVHRLGRELGGGASGARLELTVLAHVAPAGRSAPLAGPPALATLTLTRGWSYTRLRASEWVCLLVAALCAAVTLRWAWRRYRFLRSPAQLGFELLTHDQQPVTADTVVELPVPGDGEPARLRLRAVRRDGPPPRGRMEVRVAGRGLQSEVPVASGAQAARLVEAVSGGGGPVSLALGPGADDVEVELRVPPGVVDLDRVPVLTPLRAGVEVRVSGTPDHPRVRVEDRTFYVPCSITVGRSVALQGPRVLLRPFQRYLYRGLRADPARKADGRPVVLGLARVEHRADPGITARPHPVWLRVAVRAVIHWEGGGESPMRAALGEGGAPRGTSLEVTVDEPRRDLTVYLWPFAVEGPAGASGRVEVVVEGEWREERPGAAPARPLPAAQERFALYPAAEVHGIALDFGTSATRLAFLADGEPAGNVAAIPVPERLLPPPPKGRALVPELDSEVAVAADGTLVAAGFHAHTFGEENPEEGGPPLVDVLPSLKLALMDRPGDERVWAATRALIERLGQVVEGPRHAGGLPLMRWADGAWRTYPYRLPKEFRYLLLVTVPDTFNQDDQRRLAACFEGWEGRVDVLPLREAEAVVYGFLRRSDDRRPERTLVVDVGAGTVDYAAVRAEFHQEHMLEVRVEGLSVSRAAGNAYDVAVGRFTGMAQGSDEEIARDRSLVRRLRETKEQQYAEAEAVGGDPTAASERFLASPWARGYFDAAVRTPLRALLGRLSLQPGWDPSRFDQVILSGRGSLAAGWKRALVAELQAAALVPDAPEREWLHWLGPAGEGDAAVRLRQRAGRLKGAVAEGALALVTYEQTRVQTSRDILRDHLVLVTQDELGHFASTLLLAAGEVIPGAGRTVEVPAGDWIDARLLFSSHPPVVAGVKVGAALPAGEIWGGRTPAGAAEGLSIPVVREASGAISIQDRPEGADRIRVRVERGGTIHWSWVTTAREDA